MFQIANFKLLVIIKLFVFKIENLIKVFKLIIEISN